MKTGLVYSLGLYVEFIGKCNHICPAVVGRKEPPVTERCLCEDGSSSSAVEEKVKDREIREIKPEVFQILAKM